MANLFLKALQNCYTKYDKVNLSKKNSLLPKINPAELNIRELVTFHHILLFMVAFASGSSIRTIANQKLKNIAKYLSTHPTLKIKLCNSGLPFTSTIASFSFDSTLFLYNHAECIVDSPTFGSSAAPIRSLLKHSLPSIESDEAVESESDSKFLKAINVDEKEKTTFLIGEFQNMECSPKLKDKEWKSLQVFFNTTFTHLKFSLSFNRLNDVDYFYHSEQQRNIDKQKILKSPLPSPVKLSIQKSQLLTDVIKKTMILYVRETDPSTYMDSKSLRYYKLERGISIALFGMKEERQLPIESYIGYTLFKNGLPISYGGSWILGSFARFGINVFEPFRGGESEIVMAQILRTYIHGFDLKVVEIESYQIGNGNEDGIKSGAYWFYYKFGFRSTLESLANIANKEYEKIIKDKLYRTPENKLLQLSKSNMVLRLNDKHYPYFAEFTKGFNEWVKDKFNGSRFDAIKTSKQKMINDLGIKANDRLNRKTAFTEWSLMYHFKYQGNKKALSLIGEMMVEKSNNPYRYNVLLSQLVEIM